MATKNGKPQTRQNAMGMPRKVALAYVGAFGVAGDEFGKLFERFVERGERVEIDARKMLNQNRKQVVKFAGQVDKERKAAAVRANKTVKKAVKQVEDALA